MEPSTRPFSLVREHMGLCERSSPSILERFSWQGTLLILAAFRGWGLPASIRMVRSTSALMQEAVPMAGFGLWVPKGRLSHFRHHGLDPESTEQILPCRRVQG